MLSSLRHPRKRGVSVGPQSEADAREFIATREQRRRDSRSATDAVPVRPALGESSSSNYFNSPWPGLITDEDPLATPKQTLGSDSAGANQELLLSPGGFPAQPLTPPASESGRASSDDREEEEEEKQMDRAMFLALEKPRVRYDVEVITKLVIYAGIAWLAVEGNPLLFEVTGLGMGGLQ